MRPMCPASRSRSSHGRRSSPCDEIVDLLQLDVAAVEARAGRRAGDGPRPRTASRSSSPRSLRRAARRAPRRAPVPRDRTSGRSRRAASRRQTPPRPPRGLAVPRSGARSNTCQVPSPITGTSRPVLPKRRRSTTVRTIAALPSGQGAWYVPPHGERRAPREPRAHAGGDRCAFPRRELPDRLDPRAAGGAARTCGPSTGSPGSSTTSATRPPATVTRSSTSSSASSTAATTARRRPGSCGACSERSRRAPSREIRSARLIEANRIDQRRERVRDLGRRALVLHLLGRAGGATRARHLRAGGRAGARRHVGRRLHRPPARQLPPGPAARPRARPRLPAAGGPAALRGAPRRARGPALGSAARRCAGSRPLGPRRCWSKGSRSAERSAVASASRSRCSPGAVSLRSRLSSAPAGTSSRGGPHRRS